MFKNVQSDKCMSSNKDNFEKLVVHCFRKNKCNNVELTFNTAYLYYFSVSLCMFSHMIVHECMHVLRFDSAWVSGLYSPNWHGWVYIPLQTETPPDKQKFHYCAGN